MVSRPPLPHPWHNSFTHYQKYSALREDSYYVHLLFLIILSVLGQVLHQWTLQWICQESMQKFWRNRHPPTGWNVGITLVSFDTRKGLFTKFWNGTHSSRIAENQFLYTCCKMLIVALPAISFPYQSKPTCPECF